MLSTSSLFSIGIVVEFGIPLLDVGVNRLDQPHELDLYRCRCCT